uniref:ABC transporter domain-containing protein n=1 Tax=Strigamia maritima TaxID=126957 RepID=T1JGM6_STRMM
MSIGVPVTSDSRIMMSCLNQLGLILWKNWLFRRRHYVMTGLEIILPALFAIAIYLMRWSGGPVSSSVYHANFTEYKPFDLTDDPDTIKFYSRIQNYLLFYPNTSAALDLLTYVNNYTETHLIFEGVGSESDIDSTTLNWDSRDEKYIFGAVVFEGLNERGDIFDNKLKYKIRLDSYWFTDEMEVIQVFKGPPHGNVYTNQITFICLQHAIAIRAIEKKSNESNLFANYKISTVQFPFPPYYMDQEFSTVLKILLPLYITLSFIFTAPITVRRIVREKEIGIKELMKLMGIPAWIQWFGWFVSSIIIMALSAVIIVVFLCVSSNNGANDSIAVLENSAPEIVYILFLFYITSAICFCFFISSLFNKPTLAAGVTVLVWILSFCVPYYSIFEKYRTLRLSYKLSLGLLPNMAIAWALSIIAEFESQGEGIRWYNLSEPTRGDNMSMDQVLMIMLIDTFMYIALTWYVDKVFPGRYGIPKPWYFLFAKSYWKRGKLIEYVNCANNDADVNRNKFEEEPTGLSPCIAIRNLSKAYGLNSGALAVDNLSLNIYEGQITALLGHNGAGKTTTMSILTGMFPPSKGTAFVNGYDIRTEIDRARRDLGLCPQFNMLFDRLTVEEHLIFFGKLKMDSSKDLAAQVKELMRKLQISDKKDTFAINLSGGMKRKLNLGIALIGGPKVVMLDEPTSGMDPEARRSIWDLLQEYRTNRCILLSTHFMEEADILGDRIAIMANGQVECAGYHLTMCLRDNSRVNEITNMVNNHINTAILESSREFELSYNLPSNDTSHFSLLFDDLEANFESFGIKDFGLSVTTMEEVFLKVGESVAAENENEDEPPQSATISLQNENAIKKNTGFALKSQQFYGLLLKRFYYTRHRLGLLSIQFFLPIVTTLIFVFVNNSASNVTAVHQPALLLDLAPYRHCLGFVHHQSPNDSSVANYYGSSFPAKCTVRSVTDPVEYIKRMGLDDFLLYRDKLLFGAFFSSEDENRMKIRIWYNNYYRHTLPTALNLVHNSLLQYGAGNETISMSVENAPLKTADELNAFHSHIDFMRSFVAILMGVFMPVGLCVLTASFIVFPVQERVAKCKHIQLTSGVGCILFWISSFLWDLMIALISCSAAVSIIGICDRTHIFDSVNLGDLYNSLPKKWEKSEKWKLLKS